jgi:hypothetical protein
VVHITEKGMPITGPLVQEKVLVLHKELDEGEYDYTASIGCTDAGRSYLEEKKN